MEVGTEVVGVSEAAALVEAALEPWALIRGLTPRGRAIEVFSRLRVWDTQHNNGVPICVLLAEREVEIVADRGIHARAGAVTWNAICQQLKTALARAEYRTGVNKHSLYSGGTGLNRCAA